ncbi:hypothetical protein [Cupriavidus nantongensis]|uniref:hypothetical protein n=1 Tax=Cupriavidus nantongensis TaxID=1796606 RepID=UPI00358EA4BE
MPATVLGWGQNALHHSHLIVFNTKKRLKEIAGSTNSFDAMKNTMPPSLTRQAQLKSTPAIQHEAWG